MVLKAQQFRRMAALLLKRRGWRADGVDAEVHAKRALSRAKNELSAFRASVGVWRSSHRMVLRRLQERVREARAMVRRARAQDREVARYAYEKALAAAVDDVTYGRVPSEMLVRLAARTARRKERTGLLYSQYLREAKTWGAAIVESGTGLTFEVWLEKRRKQMVRARVEGRLNARVMRATEDEDAEAGDGAEGGTT